MATTKPAASKKPAGNGKPPAEQALWNTLEARLGKPSD